MTAFGMLSVIIYQQKIRRNCFMLFDEGNKFWSLGSLKNSLNCCCWFI
jgi:hypothetical protein